MVVFVKVETGTEIITVYNGYGKGFSSIGKGNTNNEEEQPNVPDKEPTKDNTTAKDKLPNTGRVLLFWIIGIVAVSGIVARIRYKKLYIK